MYQLLLSMFAGTAWDERVSAPLRDIIDWEHALHARGNRFVFRANGGLKLGVSLSKEVPV